MNKIKLTYRGWPGHFIMAHACVFHLNTLVELGRVRIIVSTVENMQLPGKRKATEIGLGRFYETMVFKAALRDGYWDQDPGERIYIYGNTLVRHVGLTSDQKANDMHEEIVQEIVDRIKEGEFNDH